MKKKFDFTAEMAKAEAIKSTQKNERLEEENHLLDNNVQELAKLNDNVFKLRTEVENLSGSIRECKPIISEEMQKLAVEFDTRLLCDFLSQIESKCKEAERRMKKSGNAIHISANTFYITIVILVALSSFFVNMIVANTEILHSNLIWKVVSICVLITIIGTIMVIVVSRILDR